MQKTEKSKRSELLCLFSQIVGVKLQRAIWVSPLAKYLVTHTVGTGISGGALERLEEFAWGRGAARNKTDMGQALTKHPGLLSA